MARPFRIVNVFTVDGDPFSGNPLCVVEDARGLSTEQMQSIARQMNLSETTFVLPAQAGGDAHVRIFTPGFEMPFAGHPTLGTAFVIAQGNGGHAANGKCAVTLEMKAGLVPVTVGDRLELRAARAPTTRPLEATRAEVAAMLGLPIDALPADPDLAPLWVNTGVEQLVIPLTSVQHVRATKPVLALIEKHGFSEARDEAMAYVWARGEAEQRARGEAEQRERGETEQRADSARERAPWEVRFFFTSNGALLEDPATGSACANLGGYLITRDEAHPSAGLPLGATLLQGAAISRPSRLHLRVERSSDGPSGHAIYVSGTAMEVGRGTLAM